MGFASLVEKGKKKSCHLHFTFMLISSRHFGVSSYHVVLRPDRHHSTGDWSNDWSNGVPLKQERNRYEFHSGTKLSIQYKNPSELSTDMTPTTRINDYSLLLRWVIVLVYILFPRGEKMHCFCPPTWRPWRHMKMLYTKSDSDSDKRRGISSSGTRNLAEEFSYVNEWNTACSSCKN